MDGLLQPRIGSLYHGVSRQAPLLRSPSQMQELDNFLPSVDLGGFADRNGTRMTSVAVAGNYQQSGHHFFRTSDGQRWVALRTATAGGFEVRNVDTGAVAALSYGAYAQSYIADATSSLRFLTLSDTTFVLNTSVAVTATVQPQPARTTCFLVVKKLNAAAQNFTFTCGSGVGVWALAKDQGTIVTRGFVAQMLANQIGANCPGVNAALVADNVIKITASEALIASAMFTNSYDTEYALMIKDRVSAITDLPATFEDGSVVMVDAGAGSTKSQYYVRYDASRTAWIECSYLPYQQTTAVLNPGSMPMRLHQVGQNSFELLPVDWVPRKTGDNDSNPLPGFVGQRLTALAQWKGRLWFGCSDGVYSSQPDDLYNFFRTSAREVQASDPVALPLDSPDATNVAWLAAMRDTLMVLCDNAQLEIPGERPVTPADAVMGIATRYPLEPTCQPRVIGDALFYSGTSAGNAVLWQYQYTQNTAGNQAEDLGKHVPRYVPGRVRAIHGSAQAGRTYLWTDADPARLYVHTQYWKDGQRAQSAWSKLSFPGATALRGHWVHEDKLYVLAVVSGYLLVLSLDVEASIGDSPDSDCRLDYRTPVQVQWNPTRNRSEVMLPTGYNGIAGLVVLVDQGDGWFREYATMTVWDGSQWLCHFPVNTGKTSGLLGVRFTRTATFSPFYPTVNEKTTPLGRLQVQRIGIDTVVSCDFTATVTRPDRVPMVTPVSPRLVASTPTPLVSRGKSFMVPFNSKGDVAALTLTSTSTGPLCVSGLTLMARYTNPTG